MLVSSRHELFTLLLVSPGRSKTFMPHCFNLVLTLVGLNCLYGHVPQNCAVVAREAIVAYGALVALVARVAREALLKL